MKTIFGYNSSQNNDKIYERAHTRFQHDSSAARLKGEPPSGQDHIKSLRDTPHFLPALAEAPAIQNVNIPAFYKQSHYQNVIKKAGNT